MNSYFSMGKAMMNGKVIYRDLYDQKGPYLYLLYGVAYLLSNRSFAGVFFFEILFGAFFLFGAYRIIRRMTDNTFYAAAVLPLLAACAFISKSFYWGGAAEEYCLPLLTYSLYSVMCLTDQNDGDCHTRTVFLNGTFAGVVMLVKYTLLGFYAAWVLFVFIQYLHKDPFGKMLRLAAVFLAGMAAAILPWIIYFGVHGALGDFYRCYVYNNLFFYTNVSDVGLGVKLYEMAKNLYWMIRENASYFIWAIAGIIGSLFLKGCQTAQRIFPIVAFGMLYFGIYIGGNKLSYYAIPLMAFCPVGFGVAGSVLLWICHGKDVAGGVSRGGMKQYIFQAALLVLTLTAGAGIALRFSYNRAYRSQTEEGFFLYTFRDMILQEENPTLLNIGDLDVGLYTLTGIVPTCEYFQANGIALPELQEEQRRYVREGRTMFVVARNHVYEPTWEVYDLIAEQTYTPSDAESTYYLFRLREMP